MNFKARTISISITVLTYVILALFIVISVTFYTKPLQPGPFYLPTISELIDDRSENASIYLIFVTIYGSVKFALIAMSLLDSKVLHSELVERKRGVNRSTPRSQRFFFVLSAITGFLAAFQLLCMILLVFFPISKVYDEHVVVAMLAFGSAMIKSLFLLIRRKLLYDVLSSFYLANIVYYLGFVGTFIGFFFTRYGYVEYILVFFILFENIFLAIEFYNLTFTLTISVEDPDSGELEEIGVPYEEAFEDTRLPTKWLRDGI